MNQLSRTSYEYLRKNPHRCPACTIFLFPFLDELRSIKGNRLCGAEGTTPPCAFSWRMIWRSHQHLWANKGIS